MSGTASESESSNSDAVAPSAEHESSAVEIPTRSSWLPSEDPLDQKLELVAWAARSKASAAALELTMIDQFRRAWQAEKGLVDTDVDHPMYRSMVWQLSAELNLPKSTVNRRLATADILLTNLPTTFSRMRGGLVSEAHVKVLIDYLGNLPDEVRGELEARLLPEAERLTARLFEKEVRRVLALREPEKLEQRHEEAMQTRDIWVTPERDGMAVLSNRMSALDAYAAEDLARQQAQALKTKGGEEETRTLGQLRSDVIRDMLLDDQAQVSVTEDGEEVRDVMRPVRGIVPTVAITVPVLALLQLARGGNPITPAMLEGYGPIPLSIAAKIAGAASGFTRILTNPHTGAPISVGTEKYRPPAEMRTTINRLDGTCRAVGCNRPAKECDLDHSTPASEGGPTELDNLAALCPNDHALKHHGEWTMIRGENRRIYWVSPLNRVYYTDPEYNLPVEDPETTLTCMDLGWVVDELLGHTVSDREAWLSDDDPESGLTVD